jgi:hypothetical protein
MGWFRYRHPSKHLIELIVLKINFSINVPQSIVVAAACLIQNAAGNTRKLNARRQQSGADFSSAAWQHPLTIAQLAILI